jgi:hypothetical protein
MATRTFNIETASSRDLPSCNLPIVPPDAAPSEPDELLFYCPICRGLYVFDPIDPRCPCGSRPGA